MEVSLLRRLRTLWPSRFGTARQATFWGLATLASLSPFTTSPAHAQAANTINIAAGSLEEALISLARQTGASIGMPGRMPRTRVKAVHGRLSIGQVLNQLLQGTDYLAIPVGPNVWRLVLKPNPGKSPVNLSARPKLAPKPRSVPAPVAQLLPEQTIDVPQEIIVTAAKRTDPLETTPIDSNVVDHIALNRLSNLATSATVASLDTGLTLTNLGPGRNRAFLRGISDSPFNGQTQSTVAILLDDARITFNAPDPELRLVDVDRVELLKGPQGPLYGTGAIGGVYRIVPAKPSLDKFGASAAVGVETVAHGGSGVSGSAMLNIPLGSDRLALRAVGYGAREPGWIDNVRAGGNNANRSQFRGGRLALRWRPDTDWTVDLAGAVQLLHVDDSQYVTSKSSLKRSGIAPEPHDNDFANARLSITGKLGNVDFFSTTSWTTHEVDSSFDASPAALDFGVTGKLQFHDDRLYRVFNQELRASGQSRRMRWMIGGSVLSAATSLIARLEPDTDEDRLVGKLSQSAREVALFGDLSVDLSSIWAIDAGARFFATRISDETFENVLTGTLRTTRKRVSPSLAISAKPTSGSYYYIRAAGAYRPAGLSPFTPPPASAFSSDELTSVELGGRWHDADRRFTGQAVAFGSRWRHIQSDYLLPNGLVATRNSGNGLIYGVEASGKWRVNDAWAFGGGLAVQNARLKNTAPGLLLPEDRRLPVIPGYRVNFDLTRSLLIGGWDVSLTTHSVLTGPGRLSLDPGLDSRVRRSFTLDLAATARHGQWSFGLSVRNLLDSDVDTHPYGNPFSIKAADQFLPLRPRAIMFRIGWDLPCTQNCR